MYDAIILMGGNARRLQKSGHSLRIKSFLEIDNKAVILHIIDSILKTDVNNIFIVYNKNFREHHFNLIRNYINDKKKVYFVLQDEILGTAYATKLVYNLFSDILLEKIVILFGDTPFINDLTIQSSVQKMTNNDYSGLLNVCEADESVFQCGRIIYDENGFIKSVIESKSYLNNLNLERSKKHSGAVFIIKKYILKILIENMKWDSDLNEYSLFRQVNVLYNFGYYFASHEIHSNEVIGVDDDEKLEIARKVYEKIKTK